MCINSIHIYIYVIVISDVFFGRKGAWWNLPAAVIPCDASPLTNRNGKKSKIIIIIITTTATTTAL